MSEKDTCPFCRAETEKYDGDWREWACGTEYWLEEDMHDQSTYCLRICVERAEKQIAALKGEVAKFDQHRWAAARLVCALRAYDGSGIPTGDASDAFKLLRKIAGDELIEAVWNGAKEVQSDE